jgi:hypothetical protein
MAPTHGSSWTPPKSWMLPPMISRLDSKEKAEFHRDLYSANGPHPMSLPVTVEAGFISEQEDEDMGLISFEDKADGGTPAPPIMPEGEAERLVLGLFGDLGRFIESTRESIDHHRAMMEHFQREHDKVQLFLSMDMAIGTEGSEPGTMSMRRETLVKQWHMLSRPDEFGPTKG